jgi:hypothetical protein
LRNGERIVPYIGGEDVNTFPDQRAPRWVIDFGSLTLEEASAWPDLLSLVEKRVRPQRNALRDTADGIKLKAHWWLYNRRCEDLYRAISGKERCLVTAVYTKHLCFSFQPVERMFNNKLFVFPLASYAQFAVLQSRIHIPWAWLLSSTLKTDLAYTPSTCFDTFPFPGTTPNDFDANLVAAGERTYIERAGFMTDTNVGLTKVYNDVKDPTLDDARIVRLRASHEEMDRAVLDAYGWTDIEVPPYCPKDDAERAAVKAFEDEVIDRLFVLNVERAAQERATSSGNAGSAASGKSKRAANTTKGAGAKGGKKSPVKDQSGGQGSLF